MAVSSPATDTTDAAETATSIEGTAEVMDAAEPAHRTAIDARVKVRSGWHGHASG